MDNRLERASEVVKRGWVVFVSVWCHGFRDPQTCAGHDGMPSPPLVTAAAVSESELHPVGLYVFGRIAQPWALGLSSAKMRLCSSVLLPAACLQRSNTGNSSFQSVSNSTGHQQRIRIAGSACTSARQASTCHRRGTRRSNVCISKASWLQVLAGQRCSEAADIWSLAVVLWEIVTGERPHRRQMRPIRFGFVFWGILVIVRVYYLGLSSTQSLAAAVEHVCGSAGSTSLPQICACTVLGFQDPTASNRSQDSRMDGCTAPGTWNDPLSQLHGSSHNAAAAGGKLTTVHDGCTRLQIAAATLSFICRAGTASRCQTLQLLHCTAAVNGLTPKVDRGS